LVGDDVRSLVELFEHSDLTELSVEQQGRKLFLRKGDVGAAEPAAEPEVAPEPQRTEVKAHMVGVFYWSRDKAGKPSLALHQRLDKGQVVGFIESMGIMNEVEAGQAGAVAEIAVAGGQPVEYGQPLVVLAPD
jgi:acetyl-CoA carboxylase biotin carboxyl carrier protein